MSCHYVYPAKGCTRDESAYDFCSSAFVSCYYRDEESGEVAQYDVDSGPRDDNYCTANSSYVWCLPRDYNQEKHPFSCKYEYEYVTQPPPPPPIHVPNAKQTLLLCRRRLRMQQSGPSISSSLSPSPSIHRVL